MRNTKRRKELKAEAMCIAVVMTIFIGTLVGLHVHKERMDRYYNMNTYITEEQNIYYSSVYIHSGDTLTSISKTMIEEKGMDIPVDVLIYNIAKINNINPNRITSGNYVIVPYYE